MADSNQDRRIREKVKQKDIDFQQQLKDQMSQEEQSLKGYFKQFKKPVAKDPTKIKRSESAAVDRAMLFKQALKPFTLPYTFYEFWSMECATAQENYTLKICKKNFINNVVKGVGLSLIVTGYVSFRFRSVFTPAMHALGFGTALASGLLFGAINSTRFTLEQFDKLGDGYELGRIANAEIQKYRMDKPTPGQA